MSGLSRSHRFAAILGFDVVRQPSLARFAEEIAGMDVAFRPRLFGPLAELPAVAARAEAALFSRHDALPAGLPIGYDRGYGSLDSQSVPPEALDRIDVAGGSALGMGASDTQLSALCLVYDGFHHRRAFRSDSL